MTINDWRLRWISNFSNVTGSWHRARMKHTVICIVAVATLTACSATPDRPDAVAQQAPAKASAQADPTPPPVDVSPRVREVSSQIIDAAMQDETAWPLLDELCTDIGPRLAGSKNLDRALQWAQSHLQTAGHQNVKIEPVTVQHWERGTESAQMTAPYRKNLAMLGLGMSVGTPNSGVSGEVVVLRSKQELQQRAQDLRGKIVLWNVPMIADPQTGNPGYGGVVGYRVRGADMVAQHGAVAMLIRSLTSNSLYTPHTGTLNYQDRKKAIPAAAITVEDAQLIERLVSDGRTVEVKLKMGAKLLGDAQSGNVVGEIVGSDKPDEIVVIGGHIDAWDVGEGAHDNGAGVVISMVALDLLRRLDLKPRRTIRVVLWTNEENGLAGARAYARDHAEEKHVAAVESDSGGARVTGLGFAAGSAESSQAAADEFDEIAGIFEQLGVTKLAPGFAGADVGPLIEQGVLGIGLRHDVSKYFDTHHTHADTLEKVNREELKQGVAAMALLAWYLAER